MTELIETEKRGYAIQELERVLQSKAFVLSRSMELYPSGERDKAYEISKEIKEAIARLNGEQTNLTTKV